MNQETKNEIIKLRAKGKGYGEIATLMNISKNSVVTFLRRKNNESIDKCPICGIKLNQTKGHRQKKFCSSKCRQLYWNQNHQSSSMTHFTCKCCGKSFLSYSSQKPQYCSRECFYKGKYRSESDGYE